MRRFSRRGIALLLAGLAGLGRAAAGPGAPRQQPNPPPPVAAAPSAPNPAFRSRCETHLPPATFEVRAPAGATQLDATRSIADLVRLAGGQTDHAVGLTVSHYTFRGHVTAPALIDPQTGLACIRAGLTLTVETGPQTVYVAREFPAGSCAYQEIITHENRHVHANQQAADDAARTLQTQLQAAYGSQIYYGDPKRLTAALKSDLTNTWLPRLQAQAQQVQFLHMRIDTPEEYERITTVCNGEIARQLAAKH